MLSIGLLPTNLLIIIIASLLATTMAQPTNPAGKPWADQPCSLIKTPQYETKKVSMRIISPSQKPSS